MSESEVPEGVDRELVMVPMKFGDHEEDLDAGRTRRPMNRVTHDHPHFRKDGGGRESEAEVDLDDAMEYKPDPAPTVNLKEDPKPKSRAAKL